MKIDVAEVGHPRASALQAKRAIAPLLIAMLLAMLMVVTSQVRATRGDSLGILVVSQSILETGSVRLDPYRDYFTKPDGTLDQVVREHEGHLYHFFPLGVPLLSLPVVALADLLGVAARDFETPLQKFLAAVSAALLAALLYALANLYFRPTVSAALAILGLVGTIIGSTISSALWSLNYELILFAAAMLLILAHARGQGRPWHPWALGIVLFLAFLVRPTAAAFILWSLLYLLLRERRWFVIAAGVSGGLLLLFVAWSLNEFGAPLPPYYSAGRLGTAGTREALAVVFLSASRNILIWSPVLLLLPVLLWRGRHLPAQVWWPLLVILLSGLSFFLINIFTDFGGVSERGWSYGPRIYTTMALAALLAAIVLAGELRRRGGRALVVPLFGALALGCLVNLPGIYNPYTWYWNSFPDVTGPAYLDIVNDWRFPQFLATHDGLERKAEVQAREFGLPDPGFVPLRGTLLLGPGATPKAISFRVPSAGGTLHLRLVALAPPGTSLRVALDGREIGRHAAAGVVGSHALAVPLAATAAGPSRARLGVAAENGKWMPSLIAYSVRLEP
jgi:xanthosine utilization system XapX-like protein